MPSKLYSSFNDSLRARQNKRLKREDPNWRKEAGGGRGLYRKLRQARELAQKDPRAATRLSALTERAQAFQANRRELLNPKKGGPAGPRPVVSHSAANSPKVGRFSSGQGTHKRKKRYSVS